MIEFHTVSEIVYGLFFTPFVAQAFMSERSSEIEPRACPTHRPIELDRHFGTIIAIAVDHDAAEPQHTNHNCARLLYIYGRLARDDKALELAYDVIKLLETDGLVYTKKVMVVCVC